MKIYVVMQTVDLGGHPQVAFCNESVAKADIENRNVNYRKQKIESLQLNMNYTKEEAEDFCKYHVEFYLDVIDLI